MKRAPKLTKRERKAISPGPKPPTSHAHSHTHIHCVACGKHLDEEQFDDPASATWIRCAHGSQFAACVGCATRGQALLDEHDRTGQPVKAAGAWH